ncbi:hypothetical protein H7F15_07295 [Pontibacter sp. Tf4]|uniref:polysialyltransferase family glycosyltransferase n=1 Tax=Pontibacter sp. Tf4 TaxID=2761620 RepID=UPI00162960E5|nr:polysialyltransferase family glycosyltransferase [Pontibacter sp. Tf4]MBB6610836.1 hypothetical protein [Pontibacter sp. Tf4]
MPKPEILFVGNYCRTDYLSMLDKALTYCHFTFLEYISPKEEQNKSYLKYGEPVYWSQFRDVNMLLQRLKPDKVVFLAIESYNHVILNLACKRAGIPTYHLEHGLRADYLINAELAAKSKQKKPVLPKISIVSARLRNRLFLERSINCFNADDKVFLKTWFKARSQSSFVELASSIKTLDRIAQNYISFSAGVFKIHKIVDHLPPDHPVRYIGIPYYDKLASVTQLAVQRAIIFIDQPLAEHHLLGWTPAYKVDFAERLKHITQLLNYKVYIKPHPLQDITIWQYSKNIELIDDSRLQDIVGSIPIVLGFYSTYLLPLAAMPHTTLITLENHPAGRLDVSKSFIDAGVAHPVYSLDELPVALENIDQLHQQQLPHKKKFEEEWLYKFDGKAGERLRDILLSDEL